MTSPVHRSAPRPQLAPMRVPSHSSNTSDSPVASPVNGYYSAPCLTTRRYEQGHHHAPSKPLEIEIDMNQLLFFARGSETPKKTENSFPTKKAYFEFLSKNHEELRTALLRNSALTTQTDAEGQTLKYYVDLSGQPVHPYLADLLENEH